MTEPQSLDGAREEPACRLVSAARVVRGEHLDRHKVLRTSLCVGWCEEIAHIAARERFDAPCSLLLSSVRDLSFHAQVHPGEIVRLQGHAAEAQNSTVEVRVEGRLLHPKDDPKLVVEGVFTFAVRSESD
jgi:acyl-CoA hydrolase